MRPISVAGFLLTLGLLVTACAEGERNCIERVLREDALASRAGNAVAVVGQMRSIETSACPEDFRQAYLNHIHAWDEKGRLVPAVDAVGKPVTGFWMALGSFSVPLLSALRKCRPRPRSRARTN